MGIDLRSLAHQAGAYNVDLWRASQTDKTVGTKTRVPGWHLENEHKKTNGWCARMIQRSLTIHDLNNGYMDISPRMAYFTF